MKKDFLAELESLGITARLKRLSDSLSAGIKELYNLNGVDIEPSWHLLLLYLKREKESTLTEIAEAFRFSQPAANKMISRMTAKGYLDISTDKNDNRKKNIRLSKRAVKKLPQFEKIWDAGQKSVRDILKSNPGFIKGLELFENENEIKSFKNRAMEKLKV